LWLQVTVELGVPGLLFLVSFYVLTVWRLWRHRKQAFDPWEAHLADMVIAAIAGFAVSSQFVSLIGLELPYYVVLAGAGVLKLGSVPRDEPEADDDSEGLSEQISHEPIGHPKTVEDRVPRSIACSNTTQNDASRMGQGL
jgi:O-antigen ligase